MHFIFSHGAVLYPTWNDDKFTFIDGHGSVSEKHIERTGNHEKKFILIFMRMPNKLALEFCQFHMLPVEFTNDLGVPVSVECEKLLFDVNYFGHDTQWPFAEKSITEFPS